MKAAMKTTRTHFRFSPGFSLLELLVVISIIGILIAMGTAAFTTAQRKSRDARRRADIKSYQNAMEQYYAVNNGSYPAAGCGAASSFFSGGTPTDPSPSKSYTCYSDADSFCACAILDETGKGNATGANAGTATCTFAADSNSYCLSNLQ
jgi:prepilin-type N-terminal cleavage/methylation domain-containing protein